MFKPISARHNISHYAWLCLCQQSRNYVSLPINSVDNQTCNKYRLAATQAIHKIKSSGNVRLLTCLCIVWWSASYIYCVIIHQPVILTACCCDTERADMEKVITHVQDLMSGAMCLMHAVAHDSKYNMCN